MKINFAVRWIFRNKITVNKILDIELNDNATIFSGPSSWYNPMDTIFSNKCDQEQSEGVSRKQILTVKEQIKSPIYDECQTHKIKPRICLVIKTGSPRQI